MANGSDYTQVVGVVTEHLMQSVPCRGGAWYRLQTNTSGRGCYRGSDAECTMQRWRMIVTAHSAQGVVVASVHLMQSVLCRARVFFDVECATKKSDARCDIALQPM